MYLDNLEGIYLFCHVSLTLRPKCKADRAGRRTLIAFNLSGLRLSFMYVITLDGF